MSVPVSFVKAAAAVAVGLKTFFSPLVTGEDGGEFASASTAALRFKWGNVDVKTSCGSSLGSFRGPSADCDRMVVSIAGQLSQVICVWAHRASA